MSKMYDLYTPMVKDVKFEMPYEEAKEWMLKALEPMGEEYLDVVKEGLNNRWVDVYENKGKRSGGYSSGAHLTNPFILLNWSDTVSDLYTLIHEFGHSDIVISVVNINHLILVIIQSLLSKLHQLVMKHY